MPAANGSLGRSCRSSAARSWSWCTTIITSPGGNPHDGEELIVVRKGATPAFPGQRGFIGGSMGDDAVIVQGNDGTDPSTRQIQRAALYSTVHGAGRIMSRTAAAGRRNRRGKVLSPGRVTPEMMDRWIEDKGVVLRGGGLDESPHVYRRLPDVLAAQGRHDRGAAHAPTADRRHGRGERSSIRTRIDWSG